MLLLKCQRRGLVYRLALIQCSFGDVCVRLGEEIRYKEANRNDSYAVMLFMPVFLYPHTYSPS